MRAGKTLGYVYHHMSAQPITEAEGQINAIAYDRLCETEIKLCHGCVMCEASHVTTENSPQGRKI